MATYAANTDVSSEKSLAELKRTITRFGATHFGYTEEPKVATVAFVVRDRQVRFRLPLPDRNERRFTHHSRGERTPSAAEAEYEQAVRQKWRALALVVKAKLEAVESGISEFDQEFLAYVVLPDGRTVYDRIGRQVGAEIESGGAARLELGS